MVSLFIKIEYACNKNISRLCIANKIFKIRNMESGGLLLTDSSGMRTENFIDSKNFGLKADLESQQLSPS